MINTRHNIRIQSCLLVLFVFCVLTGILSLIAHAWPQLPIPATLLVSVQGAMALIFGGCTMIALILRYQWVLRFSGCILIALGGYNIVHNLITAPQDSGLSLLTGQPRLENLPAFLTVLLGLLVFLGIHGERRRHFGMIMGSISALVGGLVLIVHVTGNNSDEFVWGYNAVAGFFTLTMSLSFILLVWLLHRDEVSFDPQAALSGALGVFGTFVLLVMASWGIHREQHRSAAVLVEHHAAMLSREISVSSAQTRQLAQGLAVSRESGEPLSGMFTDLISRYEETGAFQALMLLDAQWQPMMEDSRNPEHLRWLEAQVRSDALSRIRFQRQADLTQGGWVAPDPSRPLRWIYLVAWPDSDMTLLRVIDVESLLQPALHLSDGHFHMTLENTQFDSTVVLPDKLGFDHNAFESAIIEVPTGPSLRVTAMGEPVSLISLRGALLPCILLFGALASYLLTAGRSVMSMQQQKSLALHIEEQRFRSLFFQSPDAVFELATDGRYMSLNDEAKAFTGISDADLGVLKFSEYITEEAMSREDYAVFVAAFDATVKGVAQTFSVNFLNRYGQRLDYECSFMPIRVDDSVTGIYAVVKDISERIDAMENQRLLTKSLESSESAVLVFDVRDTAMPVVFANSAYCEMTGISAKEVTQSSFNTVLNAIAGRTETEQVRETIRQGEAGSFTVRSHHQSGVFFWNQFSLAPVTDDKGTVTHYTAIMHDVSEKKEHERQLAYQATHDVLTGLANRALFEDRLVHDISLTKGEAECLAVFFIDLDEFKPINDTLGHRIGDEILINVARRMQSIISPSDTLARFGGDEFVLLLPNLDSRESAEQLASQILREIGRPHRVGEHELYLTASIGISLISASLDEPARMLQEADMAMYKAKQQGRDTYVVYSEDLDASLLKRVTLRNELQEAIQAGQLFLNYQPQVDQSGNLCGLEALVRWQHPDKGLIPPGDFIPLAEETGQIIQLGQWVLHQACSDARRLLDKGLLNTRVAVNLSPLQFHRDGFLDSLSDTLKSTSLPPVHLELELTEGILMHDSEGAIALLLALEKQGIATSIDDFGTGYSSFSYLKDLTVQSVKIDKSFVDNILHNRKDAAVCKGTITMAQQMGIRVVAEGVETREQFELLHSYGCEAFQGYLFARPMSFDDLVTWIQR